MKSLRNIRLVNRSVGEFSAAVHVEEQDVSILSCISGEEMVIRRPRRQLVVVQQLSEGSGYHRH